MEEKGQLNQTMNFKNCLGVFQGGGCKALAFVGAYKEVRRRGVNFSEVAGTSAGSIFAALIAAGATPEYLEDLLYKVDFNSFNKKADEDVAIRYGFKEFPTLRKYARRYLKFKPNDKASYVLDILDNVGMYSSEALEEWLEKELQSLLDISSRTVTFNDLKLPLHVIATDINRQKQTIWNESNSGSSSVAKAVRCSCTIPLYFQPVDMNYVDGGLVSNLPSFSLNDGERHFEKILCFTLNGKVQPVKCFESYFTGIASSIIDGAIDIQEKLQNNTYNIVIRDLDLSTTDFNKITNELIEDTVLKGKLAAAEFFDNEMFEMSSPENNNKLKLTRDYLLNSVVMEDVSGYSNIYLCFDDTKIIYSLFPTILNWLTKDINITFITRNISCITKKPSKIEHEKYRRFLINRFGINLIERDSVPFDAFIYQGLNSKSICMYKGEDLKINIGNGSIYDSKVDPYINESLFNMLDIDEEENHKKHEKIRATVKKFTIESISSDQHIERLRGVVQYKNAKIKFEEKEIDLREVKLMTRYVESYKYNQIDKLNELLVNYGLDTFEPSVIRFEDDVELLITPVVIEQYNGKYIVIKGNSRLSYLFRGGSSNDNFKAVVVSGVMTKLPSSGRNYPVSDVIITTKFKKGETRYENWIYENFRNIEESVRNPKLFEEK